MTIWINITNPKDWFVSKEQFELFQWAAEEFEAIHVKGVHIVQPWG